MRFQTTMKQTLKAFGSIFAISAMMVFAASCTKENLSDEAQEHASTSYPLGPARQINVTAGLNTDGSSDKAYLNTADGLVKWEDNDPVRINNATLYAEDIRELDTVCSLVGYVKPVQQSGSSIDEYYGVYPASAISSEEDWGGNNSVTPKLNLKPLARQTRTATSGRVNNNYMVSYTTVDRDGEVKNIYFKNICALMRIGLKSTSGTQKVGKIALYTSTNTTAVLWGGTATVSFSGSNYSAVPTLTVTGDKTNKQRKLILDCGGVSVGTGSYTYFDIYVPMIKNSNIKDLCLEVYNEDSTKMMRKTVSSSNNILKRNNIYTSTIDLAFDIDGFIDADFSISATKTTKFSKGNLQYRASTDTWRFAPNQYTIQGKNKNETISQTSTEFIDLFGYGTSGYGTAKPWLTEPTEQENASGKFPNQNISNTNYDWGIYNNIGSNPKGAFYTWTVEEAEYLMNTRKTSTHNTIDNARFSVCRIEYESGKYRNGVMIFPDVYKYPSGVNKFNKNTINKTTAATADDYEKTTFTLENFRKLEAAGFVFLPSAGFRGYSTNGHGDGITVYSSIDPIDHWSMYWTGTHVDKKYAKYLLLVNSNVEVGEPNFHKSGGRSVRLVTNNYHK